LLLSWEEGLWPNRNTGHAQNTQNHLNPYVDVAVDVDVDVYMYATKHELQLKRLINRRINYEEGEQRSFERGQKGLI